MEEHGYEELSRRMYEMMGVLHLGSTISCMPIIYTISRMDMVVLDLYHPNAARLSATIAGSGGSSGSRQLEIGLDRVTESSCTGYGKGRSGSGGSIGVFNPDCRL